ncbi:uncharacterized protein RSE6_13232 [Rhynchosporium secalis]|uniref:Uncharacterized protein n=1 Tax=Rhynchosporium secalis TaxID=38038 RepID=A0A1E1MSD9_RHYSE|nr:uncharacterized protein RSE6_13232 [Rhynchosporium secalis]
MAVALSRVQVEVQVQVLVLTEREEAIYLHLTARRHTTRPKDDGTAGGDLPAVGWIIAILAKSLHHVGVPRD